MARTRKVATFALGGGAVTLSSLYATLMGEAVLARRAIGTTDERPPAPDGLYGEAQAGRTIRCLVIGDSAAVGYGMTTSDTTPAGLIGVGLAHMLDAQVEMRCHAVVGAQTSDLKAQLELAKDFKPDVAVIIVGTNDVTHRVPPRTSARRLADVVTQLTNDGCEVVVGTCPDLGTVRPILPPLRQVAMHWSRRLARQQTMAVVGAGGRAVSLGDLLGGLFREQLDAMFGDDRFHPSAAGYANMVSVLIPAVAASLHDPEQEFLDSGQPRDVMSLSDAATQAAEQPGTQVVRNGRFASVLRRRRLVLTRS
ncbi:lysophospholipase L1-like esterase [Aeromicrobium panaciterrae]|uniref:Lysophospholipase L1-like esterase n=1 Tax=Aeromicrobium panaciterrae TaxID=363861 RepID=A0ABU1ULV2_9ACTN|nr:SGNH/GDSL hydrolase family protein [Aeromicrobium panaciterrae]MDR7086119.1 lysophospholipase L1-like esterase [Aeromicrobium panaciterrae]